MLLLELSECLPSYLEYRPNLYKDWMTPSSPVTYKATSPTLFLTTLCLVLPTPLTLTCLLFFKTYNSEYYVGARITCYHYSNAKSVYPPTPALWYILRIHTLSIRHLKLDVPMPTQMRHCKKKPFSYHQGGNLEAAANLQPPLYCHPPTVTDQTLPCPLPRTHHLVPFFFLPEFRVLCLSRSISCLKSHASTCHLSSSYCYPRVLPEGWQGLLSIPEFKSTHVSLHLCLPPLKLPIAFYCSYAVQ